ncbi:MAG TPA: hypothetical protein VI277_07360 [Candidatus Limnocylindria bacterium]
MRAAAFVAGTVLGIGVFLAVAAAAGFGAAPIGVGSLAIMVVGAVAFVAGEPVRPHAGLTHARWES